MINLHDIPKETSTPRYSIPYENIPLYNFAMNVNNITTSFGNITEALQRVSFYTTNLYLTGVNTVTFDYSLTI